jgi:O-methyltransferase
MSTDGIKRATKRTFDLLVMKPSMQATTLGYLVRSAAERISAASSARQYEELFLKNGQGSKYARDIRAYILERFKRIDREMDIRTTPTDGLFLAEALLSINCPGAVVECGCFNGGSTAKLSIVASITGRQLFVFDSFEGLPEANAYNTYDLHARRSLDWVKKNHWKAGQYAAALDAVKANIERYGEVAVCTFVKGWFDETLAKNVPPQIALAFTDVDLPTSARECLVHIWPRLSEGGAFFSHDIAYVKVLQTFTDELLWKEIFNEPPPIFFGAGYGMCDSSPHLGFAVKGHVTADYLKSLTYDK